MTDPLFELAVRTNDLIPFSRFLGLEINSLHQGKVTARFAMRPEFVGNPARGVLHGGIVAAVLDSVGGFAAITALIRAKALTPTGDGSSSIPWVSTIDMRTDFLRPAVGSKFEATGYVLRSGRRVVVTRSELCNEAGEIIAAGTGTYAIPDDGQPKLRPVQ